MSGGTGSGAGAGAEAVAGTGAGSGSKAGSETGSGPGTEAGADAGSGAGDGTVEPDTGGAGDAAGSMEAMEAMEAVLDTDGPLGWRRVHGAIGLVDLEAPPELLAAELGSLRIFAGYAGWGPGQLEKELSEGAWYVVESEPGDVSSPDPERLWRSVLRRQRSELALVATYPDDPSLN
ncbi:YqgE/AlgH family protein [Streptomyces diacarni]|uniref:YqgE/AlgH family protein n=1 Tax=Streptomyces diacarni TaxID=2800381 RepID=UPI003F4CCCDE